MKAILVIDIPKNCITCQFRFAKWNEDVGTFHICSICDERLREEDFGYNRADFCPLKHMPERADIEYYKEHFYDDDLGKSITRGALRYCRAKARNEVIDEILGEQK